eukprot:gene1495-1884_t
MDQFKTEFERLNKELQSVLQSNKELIVSNKELKESYYELKEKIKLKEIQSEQKSDKSSSINAASHKLKKLIEFNEFKLSFEQNVSNLNLTENEACKLLIKSLSQQRNGIYVNCKEVLNKEPTVKELLSFIEEKEVNGKELDQGGKSARELFYAKLTGDSDGSDYKMFNSFESYIAHFRNTHSLSSLEESGKKAIFLANLPSDIRSRLEKYLFRPGRMYRDKKFTKLLDYADELVKEFEINNNENNNNINLPRGSRGGNNSSNRNNRNYRNVIIVLKWVIFPENNLTDGQTERLNRVVKNSLRKLEESQKDEWDEQLKNVQYSINSTYNSTIQCTPFEVVLGRIPNSPLNFLNNSNNTNNREIIRNIDFINIDLDSGSRKNGLNNRNVGPFRIIDKFNNGRDYKLELDYISKRHGNFNIDQLIEFKQFDRFGKNDLQFPPPDEYKHYVVEGIIGDRTFMKRKQMISFVIQEFEHDLILGTNCLNQE